MQKKIIFTLYLGHTAMRLFIVAIGFSLISSATAVLASATSYYDCGSVSFPQDLLQVAVSSRTWATFKNIEKYEGLLYSPSLDYWILQIPSQSIAQPYYVIKDQKDNVIDVLAEMKNGDYIKCELVDSSISQSAETVQNYGENFECGHELFTFEMAKFSANLGFSRMYQNNKYPAPYQGNLYIPGLEYWLVPILKDRNTDDLSRIPDDTYCVVFSSSGLIIDVIAQLKSGSHIKCTRTSRIPEVTSPNNIRTGYLCGTDFYEESHLQRTAELAKQRRAAAGRFPRLFIDERFNGVRWLFPIYPNGKFYSKGSHNPVTFLALNPSFEIVFVGLKTKQGIHPCEEALRSPEPIPPESDDFICSEQVFGHNHIIETVDNACKAMGKKNRVFPAKYIGPKLDIPGPYLTWPLMPVGMFRYRSGDYRVVVNGECQLAGVLASIDGGFERCRRASDNSVPGEISSMLITERLMLDHRPSRNRFSNAMQSIGKIAVMNSPEKDTHNAFFPGGYGQ